jgi:hypothetical protein
MPQRIFWINTRSDGDCVRGTTEIHERRFWSRVALPDESGCLPWTDPLADGYGNIWDGLRSVGAHQFSWALAYGEPPGDERTHLDHLCHTYSLSCAGGVTCPHRRCVNPDHLEWVTPAENTRRALIHESCDRGHRWDEQQPIIGPDGNRRCRICQRDRENGYYEQWRLRTPVKQRVPAAGERHPRAKLTEAAVREIRDLSLPHPVIAEMYGISRTVVTRVKARQAWKHVV